MQIKIKSLLYDVDVFDGVHGHALIDMQICVNCRLDASFATIKLGQYCEKFIFLEMHWFTIMINLHHGL